MLIFQFIGPRSSGNSIMLSQLDAGLYLLPMKITRMELKWVLKDGPSALSCLYRESCGLEVDSVENGESSERVRGESESDFACQKSLKRS